MNAINLLGFVNRIKNKQTTESEIVQTLKHHLTHNSGRRTIAAEGITTQDKARRILAEFKVFRDDQPTRYSNEYLLELVNEISKRVWTAPKSGYYALNIPPSTLTSEQVADADSWRNSVASKLTEAANKSSATIQDVAYNINVATNGAISEQAIKSQLVNLITPTKKAAEAMHDLGIAFNKTQEPVTIEGSTADYNIDIDAIKRKALDAQKKADEKYQAKQGQTITINDRKPTAVAYLSDFHIGSGGTNYDALFKDIETIDKTDGFYSGFHGDAVDNWIIGKLQSLQRGQALNFDEEWQLFLALLESMKPKLLWVVSGNHDMWSFKVGGLDRIRQALQGTKLLYDTDEVNVTLKLGDASWRHKIRHKWRSSSILNKSHPMERDLERGGDDFDIAVAGHTHIGTYFREFSFHNKMRLAILTGAYKRHDAFQREIGFAPCTHNGCGAVIYMPDGSLLPVQNIQLAAKILTALRAEA